MTSSCTVLFLFHPTLVFSSPRDCKLAFGTNASTSHTLLRRRKLCSRLIFSNLKFPLCSFPFVHLTTHALSATTKDARASALWPVCFLSWFSFQEELCRCKYLCLCLLCCQVSQALFVIISFFLSKGTVPLKTGASRPLRASRKGIGIGVNEPFIHYYYFTHLLL